MSRILTVILVDNWMNHDSLVMDCESRVGRNSYPIVWILVRFCFRLDLCTSES
jgi:hypothetical protein